MFQIPSVHLDWVRHPPLTWPEHPTCCYLHDFVTDIVVVNNTADRAVKDVQDLGQMNRDPEHRDNIILVANYHRGPVACLWKTISIFFNLQLQTYLESSSGIVAEQKSSVYTLVTHFAQQHHFCTAAHAFAQQHFHKATHVLLCFICF